MLTFLLSMVGNFAVRIENEVAIAQIEQASSTGSLEGADLLRYKALAIENSAARRAEGIIGSIVPMPGGFPEGLLGIGGDEWGTGNAGKTHKVEWVLDANGMNTGGYWGVDTSHRLDVASAEWQPHTDDDGAAPVRVEVLPLAPSGESSNTIHVTRASDEFLTRGISLPALTNTVPIAASLDGRQVSLAHYSNGAFQAFISKPEMMKGGKLEYWLAPAHNSLRATTQTIYHQQGAPVPSDTADAQWRSVLGDLPLDPIERQKAEIAYLKKGFTYSLSPIGRLSLNPAKPKLPQIAEQAFKRKQANCNIASTLLGMNNPQLNAAGGYYNTTSAVDVLSSDEGHQWNVDDEGQIIDATPGDIRENLNSAIYHDERALLKQLLLSGAALLLGGGVLLKRRKVLDAARTVRRRNAQRRLDGMSDGSLAEAVEVAQRALYAEEVQVETAKRRAGTLASQETARQKLTLPHIHSKDARAIVRRRLRMGQTRRSVLRTLRLADLATDA